jgi:hypothetical protein
MDSWLTYEEYASRYPEDALSEASFPPLACDAALFILGATRWTAVLADTEEQTDALRECQARLVHLAGSLDMGWDGVTSVSNHGYTESYATGMDKQAYLGTQQLRIVEQTLSAPATRWMLYRGASYRPPRRR